MVDDEPLLLEIFGAWLGRTGTGTLRTALNGEAALAEMAAQAFNILITDVRMPVMDGVTLVRSLAKAGISIPAVIFVSGFGDIDLKEMYSLGAEAFLSKPVRRKELIEVLERSVAARSTLWTKAMPKAPRQSLEVRVQSVDMDSEAPFRLGRGGFSARSPTPLSLGKVKFRVAFDSEPGEIVGEGQVRWYSRTSGTAGVEFTYLDPNCRSWVAARIEDTEPRGFIPN